MAHTCGCRGHFPVTPGADTRITATVTVAEVAKVPGVGAVLERLGIDHCCGAHLTLAEAAAAAGVPLDALLDTLNGAGGAG